MPAAGFRARLGSAENWLPKMPVLWYSFGKRSPPEVWSAMTITDPSSLNAASSRVLAFPAASRHKTFRLTGIVLLASAFAGVASCRAQDVAEAARQERARKDADAKKSKHVYTDEDLRRSHILTPDDQAKIQAKKREEAPATPGKPAEALDATAAPRDVPLGDVARRFRKEKQTRESRSAAPFHLPFNEPALAAPIVPAQPRTTPAPPKVVAAPPAANSAPLRRVDPFAKRLTPVTPLLPSRRATEVAPTSPAASIAPSLDTSTQPRSRARMTAPAIASISQGMDTITVKYGDSLWSLAGQNLGKASRWQELLAANPDIVDPNRILVGSRILVPRAAPGLRLRSDGKIVVHSGDTLSKIARAQYGRAGAWQCIAGANPQIRDADRIFEGQEILIPASCSP